MKTIFIWTIVLELIISHIAGCGESENISVEKTQEPETEHPTQTTQTSDLIIGDWLVTTAIVIINGVEKRENFDPRNKKMGSNIFTFNPDGIFKMTAKSSVEWQDIKEVTIIFKGTYTIEDKFLMIEVNQTIVKPPEAIEKDDELRNPIFIYGGKTGKMEYSLEGEDNILELVNDQGVRFTLERM